jgi:hypothetical protein
MQNWRFYRRHAEVLSLGILIKIYKIFLLINKIGKIIITKAPKVNILFGNTLRLYLKMNHLSPRGFNVCAMQN